MNKFWIIFILVSLWIGPLIHLWREHELCPFICRVDANGIKGAWYQTDLPGLRYSFWVSQEQRELQRSVER